MELCPESGWPHFVIWGVFRAWSFYEHRSHKLAHPIGWLGLYEWKYSPLVGDEVLFKNFEPLLKNLTTNIGIWYKLMAIYGCFLLSMFWGCQPHQLARPIGWLGLYEWKYSPLVGDEVLLKNVEPLLRNLTSNIGMWCKLMAIYRHKRLFSFTDVSRNASLIN